MRSLRGLLRTHGSEITHQGFVSCRAPLIHGGFSVLCWGVSADWQSISLLKTAALGRMIVALKRKDGDGSQRVKVRGVKRGDLTKSEFANTFAVYLTLCLPLAPPFPGSAEGMESSEADAEVSVEGSSVFSCCVCAVGVGVGVFSDVCVLHEIHASFVVRCVRPHS